jgi:3-oxoacyl-[acyl-carrier protein] reductase
MTSLDFSGKTVLVVGGSSGIGNATAQAFRERGAKVHVWGTRADAADYASEEGSNLEGLIYRQVDVADVAAIDAPDPELLRLDVLVQSQGIALYKRREYRVPDFRQVLDVNLTSLLACATRFHDALAASKGSMIVISSTAAFHATRGNPAYNASKAGAVGLTRTLAEAWARDGIRINGIAPGFVPTKLTRITTEHPERRDAALTRIPLGRFGAPEEIAGVALFLASPLASYIVGQTIPVDGGLLLL